MTAREWHTKDKSAWGYGAWQTEPDKVQWVDEATGLDCLIVRNHGGALCGYVGVSESHPWFGKGYDACMQSPACEGYCYDHSPSAAVSVHGGLTFADFCAEGSRENWQRWREHMLARKPDAATYPRGDSARAWAELGKYMDDYEGWARHAEATHICHVPEPGRPARVWWFGFDCAHCDDYSPSYDSAFGGTFGRGTYRSRTYVESEVRALAQQLAHIGGAR